MTYIPTSNTHLTSAINAYTHNKIISHLSSFTIATWLDSYLSYIYLKCCNNFTHTCNISSQVHIAMTRSGYITVILH